MPDPEVGFVQRNQAYDKGIPPLLHREPISWCGDPEIWLNGARQGIDPELVQDVWGYPECCKHPNQKIKLFNKTLGSVVISTRNNATTSINHTTGGSVVITSGSAVSATYPYTVIPPWDSFTNLFVTGGSVVIGDEADLYTSESELIITNMSIIDTDTGDEEGVETTCCPDGVIPETLTATFTSEDDCTGDPITFTLDHVSDIPYPTWSGLASLCGQDLIVSFFCITALSQMQFQVSWGDFTALWYVDREAMTSSCDPFSASTTFTIDARLVIPCDCTETSSYTVSVSA